MNRRLLMALCTGLFLLAAARPLPAQLELGEPLDPPSDQSPAAADTSRLPPVSPLSPANIYGSIQYSTEPVAVPQLNAPHAYPGGSWSTSRGRVAPDGSGQPCGPEGCGPALLAPTQPAKPPTGLFFRWDRLWTTMEAPSAATVGSPAAAGIFTSNGIPFAFINSLDTNFIDEHPQFGDRLEFGFAGADAPGGWLASVLLLDQTKSISLPGGTLQWNDPLGQLLGFADVNGDNFDDDLNGDRVYGRDGRDLGTPDPDNPGQFLTDGSGAPLYDGIPDTPAPQDSGDLVTWVPIFDSLTARNHVSMTGLEISHTRPLRWAGAAEDGDAWVWWQGFRWLFGVRYLDLEERFGLQATGSFFDATNLNTHVENFIIGPQIGLGYTGLAGGWEWNGSFRFLSGVNFQRGQQQGTLASSFDGSSSRNQPLNLNPSGFAAVQTATEFSPVLEWRADATYALTRMLAFRVGYTGWFVSGISRASTSIDYTLPTFGFDLDNDDSIVANALTLGLELRY